MSKRKWKLKNINIKLANQLSFKCSISQTYRREMLIHGTEHCKENQLQSFEYGNVGQMPIGVKRPPRFTRIWRNKRTFR